MNVWTLESSSSYCGDHIIEIYATQELAEAARSKISKDEEDSDFSYSVCQWGVVE